MGMTDPPFQLNDKTLLSIRHKLEVSHNYTIIIKYATNKHLNAKVNLCT